jgi:hypothetical protein
MERMATVHLGTDRLTVRLTAFERLACLRGDLTIPRSAVRSARAVDNGMAEVHGWRAPGGGIPGVWLVGTFRDSGTTTFAACSRTRRRAVVIELAQPDAREKGFDRLVLAVDDPAAFVAKLTGSAPTSTRNDGRPGP